MRRRLADDRLHCIVVRRGGKSTLPARNSSRCGTLMEWRSPGGGSCLDPGLRELCLTRRIMVIQRCSRALGALLLSASVLRPLTPLIAQTAPPETGSQAGSAVEEERHVHELLRQAETWRGLRAKRPVASRA